MVLVYEDERTCRSITEVATRRRDEQSSKYATYYKVWYENVKSVHNTQDDSARIWARSLRWLGRHETIPHCSKEVLWEVGRNNGKIRMDPRVLVVPGIRHPGLEVRGSAKDTFTLLEKSSL